MVGASIPQSEQTIRSPLNGHDRVERQSQGAEPLVDATPSGGGDADTGTGAFPTVERISDVF